MWFGCMCKDIEKCQTSFASVFSIYNSPVCAFYLVARKPLLCCSLWNILAKPCVCVLHSEDQIMLFICKEKAFWGGEDISLFSQFLWYVWRFKFGIRCGVQLALEARMTLGLSVVKMAEFRRMCVFVCTCVRVCVFGLVWSPWPLLYCLLYMVTGCLQEKKNKN